MSNDKTINYIEFAVADIGRSKEFYGGVFGWSFTDFGPGYCEFNDGQMKGGFALAEEVPSKGGALVVLYGEDLPSLQKEIRAAGGQIRQEIFDFPGGQRFHFSDLDGYELAVWKAS